MPELLLDLRLPLGPREAPIQRSLSLGRAAVLGPSGSGKSSLLRVIAGLLHPHDATLRFGDEAWLGPGAPPRPAHRRGVGWVPQDSLLFPHLSVEGNLRYAARLPLAPIVAWLEVGHLLSRAPRHLSGGERQRVALGRALASAPRLLLLDEPFSALDASLKSRLIPSLDEHCRAHDLPLLLVSHDPRDAAALGATAYSLTEAGLEPSAPPG